MIVPSLAAGRPAAPSLAVAPSRGPVARCYALQVADDSDETEKIERERLVREERLRRLAEASKTLREAENKVVVGEVEVIVRVRSPEGPS